MLDNPSESSGCRKRQFAAGPISTEQIEHYVVGGYHPVHLGNRFLNRRYTVVRKLGNGTCATVWLAKDTKLREYVVLKINIASNDACQQEIQVLETLCSSPNSPATAQLPVSRLLNSFDVKGPNGVHNTLVLEVLGNSLQEFIFQLLFRHGTKKAFHATGFLRELSRQIVHAVHFIHSKEIVHRDLHSGNIMFAMGSNTRKAVKKADWNGFRTPHHSQETISLHRVDGKPLDKHSPRYVVEPLPIMENIVDSPLLSSSHLVLSDFGAASTFENSNDGYHAYPEIFRPPEALFGLPISEKSDIWALGCTIFNLMTLTNMFFLESSSSSSVERDDDHLQSMIEVLGPMSGRILQLCKARKTVIDDDGNLLAKRLEHPVSDPLEVTLSADFDYQTSEELSAFESFIRSIFQWDPKKRPSAKELLQHRWLTEEFGVATLS